MWNRVKEIVADGIRDLFPANFSLVMATGIVSIACNLFKMEWLAFTLLYLNIFFYFVLWMLTLLRIFRNHSQLLADLADHNKSPGFFTLVAGTNVLGSQLVLLTSNQQAALVLWIMGLILWLVLIYAFFAVMTIKEQKPPLELGISGTWMLIVVSTQSIPVLGMLITSRFAAWKDMFEFTMLGFYLLGCMFCILLSSLILYRLLFFKMDPKDLAPPYWINMGAMAITTLAGTNILLNGNSAFLSTLTPFIKGFTIFFWATGTWWILLLFLLGAWRHLYKRYPFTYHPLYWGLVFPMGMYTVCTFQLSKALDLPFLISIPQVFVYFALLAWGLVFVGLLDSLGKKVLLAVRAPQPTGNRS